jgi:hypothetical protein
MGETTMRQYNGCSDNLSFLSPHAGPPCIAAFFFFPKREHFSSLTNVGFDVFVLMPSLVIFVKSQKLNTFVQLAVVA